MAHKYSRQREVIQEFLQGRTDHPTADTVYENVRRECPSISLGTVYRNLMLLSEMGEIRRLRVGDGAEHFDARLDDHSHFVCRSCGAVIDLELEGLDQIDALAKRGFRGQIDGHQIYFYGRCEACVKKAENDRKRA